MQLLGMSEPMPASNCCIFCHEITYGIVLFFLVLFQIYWYHLVMYLHNHMMSPMLMTQPRHIWVNRSRGTTENWYYNNKTKCKKTMCIFDGIYCANINDCCRSMDYWQISPESQTWSHKYGSNSFDLQMMANIPINGSIYRHLCLCWFDCLGRQILK